jgi:hypothetical protein
MLDLSAWSDEAVCMLINFDHPVFFWSPSIVSDLDMLHFFGVFSKLQQASVSFTMSVCPSAWKKLAPTGQIFMKFHI